MTKKLYTLLAIEGDDNKISLRPDSIFDYSDFESPEPSTEEDNLEEEEAAEPEDHREESEETDGSEEEEDYIEVLELDGEQISLDDIRELRKSGMRMSDYTKKTQEVQAERLSLQKQAAEHQEAQKLYDYLRRNKDLMDVINNYAGDELKLNPQAERPPVVTDTQPPANHDPRLDTLLRQQFIEKTQRDLEAITAKDKLVTDVELLNIAQTMNVDIPTAYKLWAGENIEKITAAKLREQSLKMNEDIKKNKAATRTLISGKTSPPPTHNKLSAAQRDAAKIMGMSEEEYAKWGAYKPK